MSKLLNENYDLLNTNESGFYYSHLRELTKLHFNFVEKKLTFLRPTSDWIAQRANSTRIKLF